MKKYLVYLTDGTKGILFFNNEGGGNVMNLKGDSVIIHTHDKDGHKIRKSGTLFKVCGEQK